MLESLKNVKKVFLNDYSDYDSEHCNNGGGYGFWEQYTREPDGTYLQTFGTTADFDFCECCGTFGNHSATIDYDPYDSGYTCGDFQYLSERELLKLINNYPETEGFFVEIKYDEEPTITKTETLDDLLSKHSTDNKPPQHYVPDDLTK